MSYSQHQNFNSSPHYRREYEEIRSSYLEEMSRARNQQKESFQKVVSPPKRIQNIVPECFYSENFDLSDSQFSASIWASAFPSSLLLLERLSYYMDLIEVELIEQVGLRSSSFFACLTTLQKLHTAVANTDHLISLIRRRLKIADNDLALSGAKILEYHITRKNLISVYRKIRLMELVRDSEKTIKQLFQQKNWNQSLDLISSINSLLENELESVISLKSVSSSIQRLSQEIEKSLQEEFLRISLQQIMNGILSVHSIGNEINKNNEEVIETITETSSSNNNHNTNTEQKQQSVEFHIEEFKFVIQGLLRVNKLHLALERYRDNVYSHIKYRIKNVLFKLLSKMEKLDKQQQQQQQQQQHTVNKDREKEREKENSIGNIFSTSISRGWRQVSSPTSLSLSLSLSTDNDFIPPSALKTSPRPNNNHSSKIVPQVDDQTSDSTDKFRNDNSTSITSSSSSPISTSSSSISPSNIPLAKTSTSNLTTNTSTTVPTTSQEDLFLNSSSSSSSSSNSPSAPTRAFDPNRIVKELSDEIFLKTMKTLFKDILDFLRLTGEHHSVLIQGLADLANEPIQKSVNQNKIDEIIEDQPSRLFEPSSTLLQTSSDSTISQKTYRSEVGNESFNILASICEYTHVRVSKLFICRNESILKQSPNQFVQLYMCAHDFILSGEKLCSKQCFQFRATLISQAKGFIESFHKRRISFLQNSLESDDWSEVNAISNDFQLFLDPFSQLSIHSSRTNSSPNVSYDTSVGCNSQTSSPDGSNPTSPRSRSGSGSSNSDSEAINGKPNESVKDMGYSKSISLENIEFKMTKGGLLFIKVLSEYLNLLDHIPSCNTHLLTVIVDLLQSFNARICELILFAGILKVNKSLKSITAKHLGLASQAVSFEIRFIPLLKEKLKTMFPQKQHVLLSDLDRVKKNCENHKQQIFSKFVEIMNEREDAYWQKTRTQVERTTLSLLSSSSSSSSSNPSSFVEEVNSMEISKAIIGFTKETGTLHRILTPYMTTQEMSEIFQSVYLMINQQLKRQFTETPSLKARAYHDVRYFVLNAVRTHADPGIELNSWFHETFSEKIDNQTNKEQNNLSPIA